MKTNICLIGVNSTYIKNIAKLLAAELEMFYADVNELMKFDLINVLEAEKICGKRYIKGLEKKKIKTVSSFENTIITTNFNSLNNNANVKTIKATSIIIFLNQSQSECMKDFSKQGLSKDELKIEKSVFEDRVDFCKKICDIEINTKKYKFEKILSLIMQELENYYN